MIAGTVINESCTIGEGMNNRIRKENKTFYGLNNTIIGKREVSRRTKLKIWVQYTFQLCFMDQRHGPWETQKNAQ